MTNIKITQEARDAAASISEWQASTGWRQCFFVSEFAGKARDGVCDDHPLVEMMQALINQTVERCAEMAEERGRYFVADHMADVRCFVKFSAKEAAAAIRTIKDN
jgi:hypothetical protein